MTVAKNIRDYQSFSSLNTYMNCNLQYYFRYVEGIKTPPAVAMIRGTAGHKGNEVNYKQKITSFVDLPESDVLDATRDKFNTESKFVEDWGDDKKDVVESRLLTLMKVVHKELHPLVQPIEVEQQYDITIPFCTLEGIEGHRIMRMYVDVNAEDGIHDNKYTAKAKSDADAATDMQLSLYSYGTKVTKVGFDSMVMTKAGKCYCKSVRAIRTRSDWAKLEIRIPQIIRAIESGSFYPANPSSWVCSEKFCGYWNICEQGAKNMNPVHFYIKQSSF